MSSQRTTTRSKSRFVISTNHVEGASNNLGFLKNFIVVFWLFFFVGDDKIVVKIDEYIGHASGRKLTSRNGKMFVPPETLKEYLSGLTKIGSKGVSRSSAWIQDLKLETFGDN